MYDSLSALTVVGRWPCADDEGKTGIRCLDAVGKNLREKDFIMEIKNRKFNKIVAVTLAAALIAGISVFSYIKYTGPKDAKTALPEAVSAPTPATLLVTVDDREITSADVDRTIDSMLGARLRALPPNQQALARKQVTPKIVESLVVMALLTRAGTQENISVTEDEIDAAMEKIKSSLPSGIDMEGYLKMMSDAGRDLRQTVREDLQIQKLLDKQIGPIPAPTEEDEETFYKDHPEIFEQPESVQVRHILIAVSPDDSESVKTEKFKRVHDIRRRLMAGEGEDFEKIAAEVSDDPSKTNGGNLGPILRGETVPAFEQAAFSQEVGKIGPVVETPFGYHIIQVRAHEPAKVVPLEEVRDRVADYLIAQKRDEAVAAYIAQLRAKAVINYHDESLRPADPA